MSARTTHNLLPLPPCLSQKQRDNLWAKVKKGPKHDCWPWQGRVGDSGYPLVWINNVQFTATRIAYLDYYGKQPGDLLVCHTCDNRRCMNPHHLFLGTHHDNMVDCHEKGRRCRGTRHHRAKLTEAQVLEILEHEGKMRWIDIARKYGVSKASIGAILKGRNWSYLTGRTAV